MSMQKHLLYITNLIIKDLQSAKIRAVTAFWKDDIDTACISFFYDGEITEEELEDLSTACAEIIAQFTHGLLEEHYIRLDYPKPLPDKFIAYKREE